MSFVIGEHQPTDHRLDLTEHKEQNRNSEFNMYSRRESEC